MQMYLSMIQNTLGGLAGLGVAGILIASLLCLSVRARYRGQLLKQGQDLAQAQLAHSQLCAEMEQARQEAVAVLSSVNAALAVDSDAQPDAGGEVWRQLGEAAALLIGRVQEQDGHLAQAAADLAGQQALAAADAAKLQSKIRSQKAYIAKLEMGRLKVFDDLNQSAQRLRQSALALAERSQAALASDRLSAENQAYKAAIAKLHWNRLKEFDELNAAIYRLHQVEAALHGQLATSQEAALQLQADITDYQATVAQLEAERQQADAALALTMADNQALMDTAGAKVSDPGTPVPLSSAAPVLAGAPVATAEVTIAALDSVAEPESVPEPEPEQIEPSPQPLFAKFMKGIKVDFNLGKAKAPEEEPASVPTPVLAVVEDAPAVVEGVAEPEQIGPSPQPLFAKFMKGIKVDFNLGKPKAPDAEPVSGPTPPVLDVQAELEPTEPPPQPLFAKFMKGIKVGKPKAPDEEPVSELPPPVVEVQEESASKPQWFSFFNKAPAPEPEPVIAVEPEPEPEGGLAKQVKGWYQKITAAKPD